MTSQPVSSIFLCSPLPHGTWRTPGMSILWCCLPTSSSVCLLFFPRSLCLARCFWPDLMNGKHDHTTAVCDSLRWSGFFVWSDYLLDLGMDFLFGKMVFVWDAYYFAVAAHFHGLYSSLTFCCEGPWFASIKEDGCDQGAHQSYLGTERNTNGMIGIIISIAIKSIIVANIVIITVPPPPPSWLSYCCALSLSRPP